MVLTVVLQRGARRMLHPVGGPGPVQRLLQTYPRVRGLAFGPRAESNADVGCLIQYAAGRRADRDWRGMGARSASEARSYVSEHLRRTISMGVWRAETSLRIRRARAMMPFGHMRWPARHAEDAAPGELIGDIAGGFARGLAPACVRRRRPPLSGLKSLVLHWMILNPDNMCILIT